MKLKRKGVFFVISSPSGGGKTTLRNVVLEKFTDIKYSVSYTTRDKRQAEEDKKDYFFISKEDFNKKIKNNEFLEYANVHSNMYGTGSHILNDIENGIDVLLDIDVQGGSSIKKKYKDAVLIFILPQAWGILEARLKARKTDSDNVINNRLNIAKKEIEHFNQYDYFLLNDTVSNMLKAFEHIFFTEKNRISRMEVDWDDFYSA